MSLPRLVLCLTLMGSSLGFAQTPEEWTPYSQPANPGTTQPPLVPATPPSEVSPPSEPPEQTPPQGVLIPHRPGPGESEGDHTALRLVVAPWAGTVMGMMGLVIGAVPSALLALPFCLGTQGIESSRCAIAVATGLSLSYTAGTALGITITGKLLGGRGEGLPTFLGALAGAATGAGIGVATRSDPGLVLGLAVGPIIGAVLGYEFSHGMATQTDQPELQARSGFRVMPMAGATPRGGLLGGLAGQF